MSQLKNYAMGAAAIIGTLAAVTEGIPKIIDNGGKIVAMVLGSDPVRSANASAVPIPESMLAKAQESIVDLGLAPSCEAFWLERNQIYNLHGRCFTSNLGRSVFENGDCVPGDVAIPQIDVDYAQTLRNRESRSGCRIDTARTTIEVTTVDGSITLGEGARQFVGQAVTQINEKGE